MEVRTAGIAKTVVGILKNGGADMDALAVKETTGLPVTLFICETNPNGSCKATPGASVSRTFNNNESATFTVLAKGSGNIVFDPANNRVRLDFVDSGGIVRGQTSAALRTN